MWNYIKETIINDPSVLVKGDGSNGITSNMVAVKRAGNYDVEKICGKKIYKTVGRDGQAEVFSIDCSGAIKTAATALGVEKVLVHCQMFVATPDKELVEYAYPNYHEFGKTILVECAASVDESGNAIAEALAKALNDSQSVDNKTLVATADGATVEVTLTKDYMVVKPENIAVAVWEDTSCDSCQGHFNDVDITDDITIDTPQVSAFANYQWIVDNLRLPSYQNVRVGGLFQDERPVPGVLYTQYSFQYKVEKSVPGGLSAVGQVVDSITTHVFYVAASATSAFETAFAACSFDTSSMYSTATEGATTVTLGDDEKVADYDNRGKKTTA